MAQSAQTRVVSVVYIYIYLYLYTHTCTLELPVLEILAYFTL